MDRLLWSSKGPARKVANIAVVSLALGLLTYIYVQPEIRQHFEHYLFDLRSRMKPKIPLINDPVVISMDRNTLPALAARTGLSGLGTEKLITRVVALLTAPEFGIQNGVILLFPNVFDYESEAMGELRQLLTTASNQQTNWFVGTLGYHGLTPFLRQLPETLERDLPVYSIDTGRKRSNAVVRKLPMAVYHAEKEEPALGFALVSQQSNIDNIAGKSVYLNFEPAASFLTIKAEDLLSAPSRFTKALSGKTVIVGFTDFRKWPFQTYEKTTANTPLKMHPVSNEARESIAYITANLIENLQQKRYLLPISAGLQVLHVVFFSLLTWYLWHRSPLQGALWVFIGFPILFYANSILMTYYSVYIPLADTLALAMVGMVAGSFTSLERNLTTLADERAGVQAGAQMAKIQARLLDSFTEELSQLTQSISEKVSNLTVPEGITDQIREVLRRFRDSLQEFSEYISDIAFFSNLMNRHDRRPKLAEFPLLPIVERVISRFPQKQLQNSKIVIEVNAALELRSSAEIVDTILFNLVANALKYAEGSDEIRIGAERVGPEVHIFVQDQGPGIAEEFHGRVFEKFYRIKDDQVYEKKGTGLGLYLCRFFAEKLGGDIRLQSKVGSGARFTLTIPR